MDDTRLTTLAPALSHAPGAIVRWGRLYGSAGALALTEAALRLDAPLVVVVPDAATAQRLEQDVRFFAGGRCPALSFSDWETLPYDVFSPHQDIVSERLATLYRLPTLHKGVLIIPVSTLMQRLPPRSYLEAHSLMLDVGQRLDLEGLRRRLEENGYRCVSQVMEHGEFAVRGSLIDLFPMGAPLPYRIELFDNEVETLRTFDPDSQRSADKVEQARMLPAREFPLDEAAVNRFRANFRNRFEGDPQRSTIYREVSQGNAPAGIEYYLPLFYEQTATLFDYLPADAQVATLEDVHGAADTFWEEIQHRYEQRRHDLERPLLPPLELFLPTDQLFGALAGFARIDMQRFERDRGANQFNFPTEHPPALGVDARAPQPTARLRAFLEGFPGRVLFAAETTGRRESLLDLLRGIGVSPAMVEDWHAFAEGEAHCAITVAPLEEGLLLGDPPLAVVAESQLFGERVLQRRRRRGRARDSDQIVRSLAELTVGAPVVHEDNGVGRYLGMQTLDVGGVTTEYLTLEYAGGDKLYVPVSSLHLISRYAGAPAESAPLHRLGSGQWEKAKRKAAERVRDVAAELLDIYARRAARQGHAAHLDEAQYAAFAAGFPFEETPDQQAAIDAVLEDLRSARPMDRLVCGDVGFGKTEVAMRAAFVAVQDGRQVAILVPTTLLVQQHTETFRDRFADWPVRVEGLSRFRSKKEQDTVIAGLGDGTVDIVIGTHKLLQDGMRFQRLGLAIIDEEHRFGVRQKERFKALRAQVDVLTLTATPIPRTLNMALASLRDLSVIASPPARRLAVKTFVHEWDDNLIQEACLREVKRGGQVYFLHNDVDTIEREARKIEALVPQARVAVAHGQMRERDLERVMSDFYHHRFNVLVCTTIIETGIDVPTANTIVINRADRFGLAQLYQLRGRVGRSHHRAYAYLVVPSQRQMTPDARKRLEAIEAIEELGTGFTLATHDLEIRGAGELLGEEQSGQMHEIGFNLYSELLERAVHALKSGRQPELERPLDHGTEIDLHLPALIPEDYLPDVHARLVMYKRIASAKDDEELRELQVEMIDRFGLLPDPTRRLFEVTQLKLKATPLGIDKIDVGPQGGRVVFCDTPNVDPLKIINLIQRQPKAYKLDGGNKLRLLQAMPDAPARIRALEDLLDSLGARAAA